MAKVYLIEARTGCTCCSDENFMEGPYIDKAKADAIVADWNQGKGNPLASQYARYGRNSVREEEAEELSGGRFIIGDTVWGPDIERK